MNKFLVVFLLCFTSLVMAQDTIADPPKIENNQLALQYVQLDTIPMEEKLFHPNFQSKYEKDDAFSYEVKIGDKSSWWDRFKEWLSNFFKNLFNFKDAVSASNFVDVLIKIIAGCLIVFVIYLIVKSIMNGEGQWIFGKSSDKKVIQYEDVERNLHLVNFEQLIKQSLKNNEHRLVIRYYYLWVLKTMSEKGVIGWDPEKTNSDYTLEIQNPNIKEQFSYASYLYNYIWYGEFELEESAFNRAQKVFENLIKSVS